MLQARMQKLSMRSWIGLCLGLFGWALFSVACSGPADPGNNNTQNHSSTPAGQTKTLSVATSSYALPEDLAKHETSFRLGSIAKLGTLVGGATGLYHLGNGKLSSLDQEPVVAIAPWRGQFLVIAQRQQLVVWDGELHPINLGDTFQDDEILDIAAQTDHVLWIATRKKLWRLQDSKLAAFDQIKDVRKLYSFTGAADVVARDKDGKLFFFRSDKDGSLRLHQLETDAPAVEQLVSGFNGMLWGLSKGKLVVREAQDEQARWGEYDWGQGGDATLAETIGALQWLISDVHTGRLWMVGEKSIVSVYGKEVAVAPRPAALKHVQALVATSDSTLWISDGKQLHQFIRTETANITYEGQVAPFMKNNCWRCHQQVGPGRPLDSYELVKKYVDNIIKQLESGGMPSDGRPLVGGDAALFKRWMESKMPQ